MEENVDENLLINFRNFFRWSSNPKSSSSKTEMYSVDNYDTAVGITSLS